MLAYFPVPLSWTDLVKRTFKETLSDNVLDLAAQQAYYFFFALFPALLFVISIASFFPLQSRMDNIVQMLSLRHGTSLRSSRARWRSCRIRTAAAS